MDSFWKRFFTAGLIASSLTTALVLVDNVSKVLQNLYNN